ncbi:hypothetical protein [Paenibacillus dendritiformis]|uniref:hypothetical protein n=1 Tax=Paenibacillus dendritiformis TaxID=130049 RepID=UPI0002FB4646|nr:hypothetical protein [Paenibacillus dendritiformis]
MTGIQPPGVSSLVWPPLSRFTRAVPYLRFSSEICYNKTTAACRPPSALRQAGGGLRPGATAPRTSGSCRFPHWPT